MKPPARPLLKLVTLEDEFAELQRAGHLTPDDFTDADGRRRGFGALVRIGQRRRKQPESC